MNLSEVNTVNELVSQNNTAVEPTVSRLDALVDNLDLNETYDLVLNLVQRLGSYHQSVIEDLKEHNELDRLVVWSQDEQKLHTCYDMLSDVASND